MIRSVPPTTPHLAKQEDLGADQRDRFLDYLRGSAILWVVVVHVFYHKQFIPAGSFGELLKRVMLFEMPLLFFVSGASLYLAQRRYSSTSAFLRRRIPRLLYPYLGLAVVCSMLFYLKQWVTGEPLSPDQILGWILLEPWPVVPVYVGFSMWFVRVMIAVTLIHPILFRLFTSDRFRLPAALLIAAAIVAVTPFTEPAFYNAVPLHQLPQYTVFYSAFAYLGYYYSRGELFRDPRRLVFILLASVALLALLTAQGFVASDGQANKFPPNLGYGLLGVTWLMFWLLLKNSICRFAASYNSLGRVLVFLSERSYTIFLYHGFGFIGADFILRYTRVLDLLAGAHYSVSLVTYLTFALGFAIGTVLIVDWGFSVTARCATHLNRSLARLRGRYETARHISI